MTDSELTPGEFRPVSLDRMAEYLELFARTPQHASDFSFTNVWGWAEYYGLEWTFAHGLCWLRQTRPEPVWWAPVGPWLDADWSRCALLGAGARFIRVPESLAMHWQRTLGDRVALAEARGQWDYLYAAQDLAELKGNKFHKKKNHVNGFLKAYPHEYHPMTPDCIEAVLDMQEEWCKWRECDESHALVAENTAVRRVLEHWDRIPGLSGGALYVEGKMIAYTVGERLDDETLVVHFEKAKPEYRGVYQAINNLYAREHAMSFRYINREQDLDDLGLRQAKESYNPVGFLKKFAVDVAPA